MNASGEIKKKKKLMDLMIQRAHSIVEDSSLMMELFKRKFIDNLASMCLCTRVNARLFPTWIVNTSRPQEEREKRLRICERRSTRGTRKDV